MDARLDADDVRLTMGGEPTYVSATDTTEPEWNIAADGADKRERATELAKRLKDHYAPSGIVQHGQGKWYPGEPLPRWQIAITWRSDGAPLWTRPDLLDWPWEEPRHDQDKRHRTAPVDCSPSWPRAWASRTRSCSRCTRTG